MPPADEIDFDKYRRLTYDDFRKLAGDDNLSQYEKIGFPDEYRKGHEEDIFSDIKSKLHCLEETGKVIADIGCGCSDLAHLMIENCGIRESTLILVDCEEMLSLLPDRDFIRKFPGRFPHCPELFDEFTGVVDGVLIYSVLQSVFLEANIFDFLDNACTLLKDGGEILIGDIPNISKRKRFFSSANGIKYHQEFTRTNEIPDVDFTTIEKERIDDGVVLGILARYRGFGFDSYLLPQSEKLTMANRREDILIRKP
jgi:hypothetical protein